MEELDPELKRYQQHQEQALLHWESLCGRCGACCGAFDGDPCEHLSRNDKQQYFCTIYHNRFGLKRTVNGNTIKCVPIRSILHTTWPGDHCCGYKNKDKVKLNK